MIFGHTRLVGRGDAERVPLALESAEIDRPLLLLLALAATDASSETAAIILVMRGKASLRGSTAVR